MPSIILNDLFLWWVGWGGDLCGLCKAHCQWTHPAHFALDCSMSVFGILEVFKKNCLESLDCRDTVDMTNSDTTILWTPIFKWYVVRCGSKNGQKKDVFNRDWTRLCTSNMRTILGLMT